MLLAIRTLFITTPKMPTLLSAVDALSLHVVDKRVTIALQVFGLPSILLIQQTTPLDKKLLLNNIVCLPDSPTASFATVLGKLLPLAVRRL